MALFGDAQLGSTKGHKHLIEMKAGKMHRKGTWVYPDKRKGMLYVYQNNYEFLMHFCWKERTRDYIEDDFIIFPDETTYARVPECTTGRVYMLKFHDSLVRVFYWLQEPKTDKDEIHCRIINDFLNHPERSLPGNFPNKFSNISPSYLKELFGPEAAAQLSSFFQADDGASSSSKPQTLPSSKANDVPKIPNNTPASDRSSNSLASRHKRRSSLKNGSKDSKKKNVTIVDDIEVMDNMMGFGGDEDQWEDDDLGYEGNDEESIDEDDDEDEVETPPKKK